MRYMLLIYGSADARPDPEPGTPEHAAMMQPWFDYTAELEASGAMLGGDALQGIESATTVRVREGKTITTDGPFAETKEVLGGYYMVDVDNLDQALEWAAKIPAAPWGSIEVRPIMELPEPPA